MENRIFAAFPANSGRQLVRLCRELLGEQKEKWPGLAAAYAGLAAVQTRLVSCSGYDVRVQYNPARAASSGAAVDKESIAKRPCFLCADNLPREQRGILYGNEYLLLCNPAPILENHFTVVNLQHQPQAIGRPVKRLLDLAADLAPDFVLFYNGPACGASAPDHLHFQAIPAHTLPLPAALAGHCRIIRDGAVKIYGAQGIDRAVLVLAGSDRGLLLEQFDRVLQAARHTVPAAAEPMINVLCCAAGGGWRIMIFFRAKHRPAAYYREGEERVFVSLGTIDMAGLIITPRFTDFQRLDAAQIGGIYREVSLPENALAQIVQRL